MAIILVTVICLVLAFDGYLFLRKPMETMSLFKDMLSSGTPAISRGEHAVVEANNSGTIVQNISVGSGYMQVYNERRGLWNTVVFPLCGAVTTLVMYVTYKPHNDRSPLFYRRGGIYWRTSFPPNQRHPRPVFLIVVSYWVIPLSRSRANKYVNVFDIRSVFHIPSVFWFLLYTLCLSV